MIDLVVKYWLRGWVYEVWYKSGDVITFPDGIPADVRKFIKQSKPEVQYDRTFTKWLWVYRGYSNGR